MRDFKTDNAKPIIVPSIVGRSIEMCVPSSAKLCVDPGKQWTALKAFSYYVAFEWHFEMNLFSFDCAQQAKEEECGCS